MAISKNNSKINLEQKYFSEEIAGSNLNNNILYQLTYLEKEILLYSFPNLQLINKIKMPEELNQGWGMALGKKKMNFLLLMEAIKYLYS